jgi:hypothetical protein
MIQISLFPLSSNTLTGFPHAFFVGASERGADSGFFRADLSVPTHNIEHTTYD